MKKKILVALMLGIFLGSLKFSHISVANVNTGNTSQINFLHLLSTQNQNRLTAQMRDSLLRLLQTRLNNYNSKMQQLESRITALENRPIFSADIGRKIWFRGDADHTPNCPSGWLSMATGTYVYNGSLRATRRSRLCKLALPAQSVAAGTKCTTNLTSSNVNGYHFSLSYEVGTINNEGKCIATSTKTFRQGGSDRIGNGERNLNKIK